MKLSGLALIAAVATSALAASPSFADRQVEVHKTVVSSHSTTHTTSGWHNRRHKVCHTRWVHHHKVTRCNWQ
jgi:hypothetical protein